MANILGKEHPWIVCYGGEFSIAYLERVDDPDDGQSSDLPLIWWDYNHDSEICEEGQEEAASQTTLPGR